MDAFSKLADLIVDFIKKFIDTIKEMISEFRSMNDGEDESVSE